MVGAASACGGDGSNTGGPEDASDVPAARGYHVLLSLDDGRGVLLYGGQPGDWGQGKPFQDTWTYTPSTGWVELIPEDQLPMRGVAAAYVAAADQVVVAAFHDRVWADVSPQTWIYDLSTDRWQRSGAGEHPGGLAAARAAYDLESNRVILINGSRETWAYDVETDTWTEMAPKVSPPRRESAQLAYDVDADRVVLFGGGGATNLNAIPASDRSLADTWAYDYNTDTWTELTPKVSPPARSRSAMAYDPASGRTILFGGMSGNFGLGEPLGDTWAFDYETNTWTELSPAEAPSARGFHAMAYNPADETIVLFGGGEGRSAFENDTWIYDPAKNTWTPAP
jgi:N-acetylneuraminic acid mutarotase